MLEASGRDDAAAGSAVAGELLQSSQLSEVVALAFSNLIILIRPATWSGFARK